MGKEASSLPNMVLTLVIITIVAGTSLGYIYKLTEEPINESREQKQQEAIRLVVPDFDNNPAEDMYEITTDEGETLKVFPAKKDGEEVGVAIESVSPKGYSGDVRIMVGILPDGTINNYAVLEHTETPGLGSKMEEWFKPSEEEGDSGSPLFNWLFGIKSESDGDNSSIVGVDPSQTDLSVAKDGGDIDGITAATISSRAFLDAVRKAWSTYTEEADSHSSATTKENEQQEGGEQ
ncbi:MAG: RnfABCDGE type electron transport complex subunit G [Bacteroidota bacterium]